MPDPEVIEVQEVEGVGPQAVVPDDDDDSVETEDKEFGDAFQEAIKKATEPEGEKVEEKPVDEAKAKEKTAEKKEAAKPSGKEKTLLEQAEERGKSLLEEQKKATAQPPVKKEEPKPEEKIEPKPDEKKPDEKPKDYEDDDVKEFAADFPAAAKLASAEAARLIDDKIKSGRLSTRKRLSRL